MERKFKGTPPRLPILFQREHDPLYLVTFNTLLRRPLLANESVHKAFRTYAERGLAFNVATGRYVLMPDHVHIFVRIGRDMKLSRWESGLKQCLGKALKLLGHEPTTLIGCSVEPAARKSEEGFGHRPNATNATDARVEGVLKSFWQPGFFSIAAGRKLRREMELRLAKSGSREAGRQIGGLAVSGRDSQD